MKNETICECGHLKEFHGCDARDLDDRECKRNGVCGLDCDCTAFTAAKSLRDEMFEAAACLLFNDPYRRYSIECLNHTGIGDTWSVMDRRDGSAFSLPFDKPEEAFAWLKDHLKEQK